MNDHRRRIASAIKAGRARLGLRQGDLGELVGVKQSAVAAWELGNAMPTVETFFSLARVLGLDVDELINPEPVEGDESSTRSAAAGQQRSELAPVGAPAGGSAPPGETHTAPPGGPTGPPLSGPAANDTGGVTAHLFDRKAAADG